MSAALMPEELYFLVLLRHGLAETCPPAPPSALRGRVLFDLARRQHLESLILRALERRADTPTSLLHALEQVRVLDMERARLQTEAAERVLTLLPDCLPLRGIVLRELYPEPHLRHMTDLDFWVAHEDLARATALLCAEGYSLYAQKADESVLTAPPCLCVELHARLDGIPRGREDGMRARAADGRLRAADFYAALLTHFAKHLRAAGAGARFILDIGLYGGAYGSFADTDLARSAETLYAAWMSGVELDTTQLAFSKYLLSGTALGGSVQRETNELAQSGGRLSHFLRLLGRPRYIFSRLFAKDSRARLRLRDNLSVSKAEMRERRKLFQDLGL
ncbi:MAG: nucleotidyltransferase family protein [Clostridiales bacterium]|nr:nucleotidyltransferase family protein [Clostridiales bacterium]